MADYPKIQTRKDSYDVKGTGAEQLADGHTPVFEFRPQERTPDQGCGMMEQVQQRGQSGDTGDMSVQKFLTGHPGAGAPPAMDGLDRTTDVYTDPPADGYSQTPATTDGIGSFEGNVANVKNAGPKGTWNFVSKG
jgi:hypothetical protein